MDIVKIADNKYKIKIKCGSVAVNVGKSVEILSSISKAPFVITQPGEYEVEGISVFAYQTGDTLASVIHVEDLKVLVTSGVLSDSLIEDQGTIDVIIVNTNSVQSKQNVAMIGKIEPSFVLPSGDRPNIETFIKDFEHTSRETNKLSFTKATLNPDITDVVILTD
ncbi:MAG: hypothetical protein Fur0011_4000 [Candidatus Microgenomates bacterium]